MGSMSNLSRNTLLLTVASIGQKAVAFIYFALIAKEMSFESTGVYFLALALTTTIGVLDDLGVTSVVIREVARKPEKALTWVKSALGVKLIAMPLTVLVAFIMPSLLHFSGEATELVKIAVLVMLADTLSLTFYGVLRGLQQLKYESIGIFIGQSLTTIFGATLLLTGQATLPLLIVALIIGSVWNTFFSAYQVVRRLGWGAIVPSFEMGLVPLKMAFAFFLSAVFVKIYSYVDSFTLNVVIGEAAVGLYSVAYKLTYAFQFLPLAFVGALYPTLSAIVDDRARLKKIVLDAEWYLALLVAPIVFGIFALSPEIIDKFYGADYAASVPVLSVLIFALLFIFLDFPLGALLNATGHQMTKTKIMGATMVVNVGANFIFIPWLGIVGAAVAGVISFAFMFLAGWFAIRRVVDIRFGELFVRTGGLLLAGLVMALVVMTLKQFIPWVLTVPVGAGVFFAIAFVTKTFTLNHARAFRAMLGRPKYAESPSTNT